MVRPTPGSAVAAPSWGNSCHGWLRPPPVVGSRVALRRHPRGVGRLDLLGARGPRRVSCEGTLQHVWLTRVVNTQQILGQPGAGVSLAPAYWQHMITQCYCRAPCCLFSPPVLLPDGLWAGGVVRLLGPPCVFCCLMAFPGLLGGGPPVCSPGSVERDSPS